MTNFMKLLGSNLSSVPVLEPESPQAEAMYHLLLVVVLISAVIFTIVTLLIVIALWRGRARADLPQQNFGSHKAEIFWMVGPVIIVLWIAAISGKLILTMNAAPLAHPPRDEVADRELTVIGHQWWWEVQYSDLSTIAANEIHIPVGKKIRVKLQSADVVHCFWVPQLARKMDVIPGRDNYIWLQADRAGVFQGRCAEFCGTQHAWMNFKVYALSEADYERWQAGQKVDVLDLQEPDALAGKKLFFEQTCSNCHTIEGTHAAATIGPDLTKLALRKELGGGVIGNTRENLALWMKNPQAIKPGCKMPNFNFTDSEVEQLVSYLETLR